ncbi:MAG: YciI family protein [Paludibacter sp.]
MRKILLLLVVFAFPVMGLFAQKSNANYNEALAKKLHADDLGMKMYVLAILKTGNNKVTDKTLRDSLFAGHFANINRLASLKKLIVAGPLEKNDKTYRGIFILDVSSIEEAKQLLDSDPTIKQNIFDVEYFNWYGSAALPEYLDAADKIWKKKP